MEKFLIIKPSSLGDIIHGLQVVQSLKDQKPDAYVAWVVEESFASIVEACSCVDKVLIFERKGGLKAFWKLIHSIRQDTYDYTLDLQGLARSGLMAFLAKASHTIGRSDAREFSSLAYSQQTIQPSDLIKNRGGPHSKRHAIDILLDFLSTLNLQPELSGPLRFKPLSPKLELSEPPLLLFPNSRRPEKEWPYFRLLTEDLIRRYPHLPIIWLGQSPIALPRNANEGRFLNLISQTNLLEALSFIQSARLCIANDSGPMHMAAALHKPILALFGPTIPECYGPYPLDCHRHTVLRAPKARLDLLAEESVIQHVIQLLEV